MREVEPTVVAKPTRRRSLAGPLAGLGALLILGAGGITLASRPAPEPDITPAIPPTPMLVNSSFVGPLIPKEMGPPKPAELDQMGPPAPPRRIAAAGVSATTSGPRGSIGFIGPVAGPLNTALPQSGPLVGPVWERKALPNVMAGPLLLARTPAGSVPSTPAAPQTNSDISSELPDERTVALSRLANPEMQVRATVPAKADEVTAEKPLALRVAIKASNFHTGDAVTARVSANAACYAALIRVDAAGKATTVFQTARPSKDFTCLLKAGPSAGSEYLLAVASTQPLTAADVAAALRGGGGGFTAVKTTVDGGIAPAAAWTQAVALVDSLDGGQRKLARYEWSADTATFVTQPAALLERPKVRAPEAKPAPDPAAEKGEGSTLPKPAAPESKPESKPAPAPSEDSVLPK